MVFPWIALYRLIILEEPIIFEDPRSDQICYHVVEANSMVLDTLLVRYIVD